MKIKSGVRVLGKFELASDPNENTYFGFSNFKLPEALIFDYSDFDRSIFSEPSSGTELGCPIAELLVS